MRLKRIYARTCRATVRTYLLEPRSGICHPVTAEMVFASPGHAFIAWLRCKMGHVIGDGTPRPPCTAPPLWQQEEIDAEEYALIASTIPKDVRLLLSQQSLDALVAERKASR